jgi:hypothetical protein
MSIVERAKNICLTPKTEWPIIAAEASSTSALITEYVAPLAAIGAVAGLIGGSLVGVSLPFVGTYRVPIAAGLGLAIFTFVMAIVGIFVLSFIINALAPTFKGEQNSAQALKVAVYSYTPAWVAGVLQILPTLGIIAALAALYGLYLLYLGLPRLMKCPEDKAAGYTIVVLISAVVLFIIVGAAGAAITGTAMMGRAALSGPLGGGAPASTSRVDQNSPLGKLQQLSEKLEESGKKMEAAEKRGDSQGQVTAAIESLGTLLGGGKRVEPVGIEQLKPFVPETFAGLPRTSSNAEKSGIAGLMVSKAEATYDNGAGKSVTLEVSDTGGVSGLVALAGWAGVQGEKEDQNGSERTQKVNGRLVHEKISKRGGSNEYGLVLGDRFVVSAEGTGVDLATLKAALSGLDLGKLESMKDLGVKP